MDGEDRGISVRQWSLIKRLSKCRFLPASWDKRFVKHLAAILERDDWYMVELSPKQIKQLERLEHSYRRQLANIPDPMGRYLSLDERKPVQLHLFSEKEES